ncbi:MAG: translation elongation factor-like protein [Candidatus Aenigmatarchaeota archaeon]
MPEKIAIGKVSHFFNKIGVAVIDLTKELKVGDRISIEGRGKTVEQVVSSMEVEHEKVTVAAGGTSVGLKVAQPVKEGDSVFKLV